MQRIPRSLALARILAPGAALGAIGLVGTLGLAASCAAGDGAPRAQPLPAREARAASPSPPPFEEAIELALPAGWSTLDLLGFERLALAWPAVPRGTPTRLSARDLEILARALEPADTGADMGANTGAETSADTSADSSAGTGADMDPEALAVRAAVLLARSADPRAIDVITARLEQRWMGPARATDAGDVVAAAGLRSFPPSELGSRDVPARLAALAAGHAPHPDLEVRVEIAALALELGREEPIPFLLSVLRAGTAPGPWPDFERKQTLAWSKQRAAAALAARAGSADRFNPEGSHADQRAEAARLEALLAPGR